MAADWHRAFPDMVFMAEDIAVDGETLVGQYTARGTHLGAFDGIEARGADVVLTGTYWFAFRGGAVTDWWHNEDWQAFMEQIKQARSASQRSLNKETGANRGSRRAIPGISPRPSERARGTSSGSRRPGVV